MKKSKILLILLAANLYFFLLSAPFVIFYGPFQSLKTIAVATIYTSRHPQVAEFFLSKEQISGLLSSSNLKGIMVEPVIQSKDQIIIDNQNGIKIENIEGRYFKGKVMLVEDPLQIRLGVTGELGIAGQRLSELVADNGAVAGINGGGFYDPNAQGNGAYPDGITVSDGFIIHNNLADHEEAEIIGFDQEGTLILSNMTAEDISLHKIRHAVTFHPVLLKDGSPQIEGDGGWGIAPRTGIGQKADGTVILVVIDGRQPGWSMGATLRDLMNVFLEYGAVQAANLDGGSSTEMIYKGQIVNSLWNMYGERYIPTAFLVMPKEHTTQEKK